MRLLTSEQIAPETESSKSLLEVRDRPVRTGLWIMFNVPALGVFGLAWNQSSLAAAVALPDYWC